MISRMAHGADVVLYAPSDELADTAHITERDIRTRPNPEYPGAPKGKRRRRRRTLEHPELDLYGGNDGLLVRTALIRSESYGTRGPLIIASFEDVANLCRHLQYADQEHVVTISLNNRNEALAIHEVAIGPQGHASGTAQDSIKVAMLTSATQLIIVHNHPSGNPRPSADDIKMTIAISKAAQCIGLQLLDHVIVARDGFSSIRDVAGSLDPESLAESLIMASDVAVAEWDE